MALKDIAAQLGTSVGMVAITQSEQPAVIVSGGVIHHSAPLLVNRVIDATGAGDLFAAGFLHAWLQGAAAEACAQRGHAMASHIIKQLGARSTVLSQALVA